jgi:hypothetical protein
MDVKYYLQETASLLLLIPFIPLALVLWSIDSIGNTPTEGEYNEE